MVAVIEGWVGLQKCCYFEQGHVERHINESVHTSYTGMRTSRPAGHEKKALSELVIEYTVTHTYTTWI